MFKLMFKTLVFACVAMLCAVNMEFAEVSATEELDVPVSFEYGTSRSVGYGKLVDDTTYFHIRSFSDENGAINVDWDAKTATARVICPNLTVSATVRRPDRRKGGGDHGPGIRLRSCQYSGRHRSQRRLLPF